MTEKLTCAFAAVALAAVAACGADDEKKPGEKPAPKPTAAAPAEAPAPPEEPPAPVEQEEITPDDLPPALAKVHEGTTGIDSSAGKWKKFHEAVVAKHGEPTIEVEMYGKPAYFWAARDGDVCVKFGYPQPEDLKAQTWSTWSPDIVQPPAPGLEFGQKMLAERRWNECISYAEGKEPPE